VSGSTAPPELYWVPLEQPPQPPQPPSEGSASEPSTGGPATERKEERAGLSSQPREVMQFQVAFSTVSIFFSVWSRAQGWQNAMASRWRGRLWRLATVATLSLFFIPAGCFQTRGAWMQSPNPLPNQLYRDNAQAVRTENGSIPMPSEPYGWQKRAPCDLKRGESEKRGGCWIETKSPPPCSNMAVEDEGRCFVPVPAEPKSPRTDVPKKP
jgi:hypothetical protein